MHSVKSFAHETVGAALLLLLLLLLLMLFRRRRRRSINSDSRLPDFGVLPTEKLKFGEFTVSMTGSDQR